MNYEEMDRLNSTLDERTLEALSKVYYGHELWFEKPSIKGEKVSCHLMHGHNMSIDGVSPKMYVNSFIYTPDKKRKVKGNEKEGKEDWLVSTPKTADGDYTFYIDSSSVWCKDAKGKWTMGSKSKVKKVAYSGAYQLVAKKIIPVNAKGDFTPRAHTTLDILPASRSIKVGESIAFKVKYERRNLTGVQMKAYCKESKKEVMVDIVGGNATVKIDSKGTWMFLVRYRDESKKVSEEYDETVFVTTLVMETF
jgi:uncharacterized GH25 family protein